MHFSLSRSRSLALSAMESSAGGQIKEAADCAEGNYRALVDLLRRAPMSSSPAPVLRPTVTAWGQQGHHGAPPLPTPFFCTVIPFSWFENICDPNLYISVHLCQHTFGFDPNRLWLVISMSQRMCAHRTTPHVGSSRWLVA